MSFRFKKSLALLCWVFLTTSVSLANNIAAPAAHQNDAVKHSIVNLYAKVAGSVVTIKSELGNEASGIGSGVLMHSEGFVVTAAHVVEQAQVIRVYFLDGTETDAKIVTLSRTEDLALLKLGHVPQNTFIPELVDSDTLKVGQSLFCIGAPLGLGHSMSHGIISALRLDNREDLGFFPKQVIQTDAAINHGNSGGALFDLSGNVVGIASFIRSESGGSVGLGFAVPSNVVKKRLFDKAIPYLGMSLRRLPDALATALNWPKGSLLVEKVQKDSAAEVAGVRGGFVPSSFYGMEVMMGGDLILRVGNYHPARADQIHLYLQNLKSGDTITYMILRGGQTHSLSVRVPDLTAIPRL
jgi:serine protease Do